MGHLPSARDLPLVGHPQQPPGVVPEPPPPASACTPLPFWGSRPRTERRGQGSRAPPRAFETGSATHIHGGLELVYLPVAEEGGDVLEVPQPLHASLMAHPRQ